MAQANSITSMFRAVRHLLGRDRTRRLLVLSSRSYCQQKVQTENRETHFGFQTVKEEEKEQKVHDVFETVAESYDNMNDAMSFGIHRIWKDIFMQRLSPTLDTRLLDVAGGTGDISFRFLNYQRVLDKEKLSTVDLESSLKIDAGKVTVCDINEAMLAVGKKRAEKLGYEKEIQWIHGNAEKLPLESETFDAYTIAFGIRNVTHIDKALVSPLAPSELLVPRTHSSRPLALHGSASNTSLVIHMQPILLCDFSDEMFEKDMVEKNMMRKPLRPILLLAFNLDGVYFSKINQKVLQEMFSVEDNPVTSLVIIGSQHSVLEEAYRVLRPGGRFMCLEFSQVSNALLRRIYDEYSMQVIPAMGVIIAGAWEPYQYLVESIRKFPNQEDFKRMIQSAGFSEVAFENLSCGVVAIHSGFKL